MDIENIELLEGFNMLHSALILLGLSLISRVILIASVESPKSKL